MLLKENPNFSLHRKLICFQLLWLSPWLARLSKRLESASAYLSPRIEDKLNPMVEFVSGESTTLFPSFKRETVLIIIEN